MQLRVIYCDCCERPFRSIVRADAERGRPLTLEKGHWVGASAPRLLCGGIVCNVMVSPPHAPFAPARAFDDLVMLPCEFDYLDEFAATAKTWVSLDVEHLLRELHVDYDVMLAVGRAVAVEHAADRCDDFIAGVDYVFEKLRAVPTLPTKREQTIAARVKQRNQRGLAPLTPPRRRRPRSSIAKEKLRRGATAKRRVARTAAAKRRRATRLAARAAQQASFKRRRATRLAAYKRRRAARLAARKRRDRTKRYVLGTPPKSATPVRRRLVFHDSS